MKNFRQFNEDASDKLGAMSDSQIDDMKKKNPGAAAKIDQLRKKRASSAPSSDQKALPTSAITKAGGALAKKPSGAEVARTKARQSQMGKFAQGIKNAPKALPSSAQSSSSSSNSSSSQKQLPAGKEKKQFDYMTSPANQNSSDAQTRRRAREDARKKKIDDIKYERGQKLKKKAGQAKNLVGGAIKGIGSAASKVLKTNTSGSVGSDSGDSMETLQRNSY